MTTRYAIGVDVGGTKLAGGLVAGDGTVVRRTRRDTPARSSGGILEAVVGVVEELSADVGSGRLPVGVGAPGIVDLEGTVRYAPNIDWVDEPVAGALTKMLDTRVTVDNDANAAAWGEYRCGAGREADDSLVMLTIGTGVGGGLVLGGRLVRGSAGLGGEFGHIIVAEGGAPCACGNRGCLEALASGTAIGRTARDRIADGSISQASALHDLEEVTGKSVSQVAAAGDEGGRAILAEVGHWLGVGIASLVNALDPQMVSVGGGGMHAGELLLGPARESARARIVGQAHRTMPPIVPAALGDDAGVIGAALLALEDV